MITKIENMFEYTTHGNTPLQGTCITKPGLFVLTLSSRSFPNVVIEVSG